MNILVSPHDGGSFYFRSDATLIRSLTDFYIPDYVEGISVVPAICFRSERSGKSVPEKFAGRYLGPFSCGLILQASLRADMVQESDRLFVRNALDYSTVIPYELIPVDRLGGYISVSKPFEIKINGITGRTVSSCPSMQELCGRFAAISRYSSVRTGDMIAFELCDALPVGSNERLTAHFGTGGLISIIVH